MDMADEEDDRATDRPEARVTAEDSGIDGGTPSAIKAADGVVAAQSKFTEVDASQERARIEWIRPPDLAARVATRVAERGLEWNVRANQWSREHAGQVRDRLAQARNRVLLAPASVFGRTRNIDAPGRDATGL